MIRSSYGSFEWTYDGRVFSTYFTNPLDKGNKIKIDYHLTEVERAIWNRQMGMEESGLEKKL